MVDLKYAWLQPWKGVAGAVVEGSALSRLGVLRSCHLGLPGRSAVQQKLAEEWHFDEQDLLLRFPVYTAAVGGTRVLAVVVEQQQRQRRRVGVEMDLAAVPVTGSDELAAIDTLVDGQKPPGNRLTGHCPVESTT